MNKKYVMARWIFILGLFILMFDVYIFFQPSARVQADASTQPTANVVTTDVPGPDQPQSPPTAADDQQPPANQPDEATQNAPTSQPAQATDKPVDTADAGKVIATDIPVNTAVLAQATDTLVTQVATQSDQSTPTDATAQATDEPTISVTNTTQSEATTQPTASTVVPSDLRATSEATAEATIGTEPTSEATAETTQDAAITNTPVVVNTDAAPESTSAATQPVEATSEIKPLALVVVPAAAEPDIELGVTCPSPGVASFTLRNNGGDMPTPGNYAVSNPASSQSFQLLAGASISFLAAGDATVTATYTTTSGTQVTLGATGQCANQPTPTPTQSPTRGPTRTPSRTPTPSITPTASNTSRPTNTPTITRTPTITPTPSRTLTPSITPTPTITLTPSITPTPTITFTPSNTPTPTLTFTPSNTPLPTLTFTPSNTPTVTLTPSITPTPSPTSTFQPGTPLIELNVACLPVAPGTAPQARFRLRNVGGDMLTPGTRTLQETGKPARQEPFLLKAGQVEDLIAAGDAQVNVDYSTIVFSSVSLGVTGTCLNTPTLTPTFTRVVPTNTPRPQPTSVSTTVPTSLPTVVPTSTRIIVPTSTPTAPTASLTPMTPVSSVNITGATPTGPAPVGAAQAVATNAPEACGSADDSSGFPVVNMGTSNCVPQATTLERPAWTPVTVGGAVCPDWLIYHTNMTGDWEIFRLGNLPDGIQADPNLSRGIGRRVYDLMPSRSPDEMWIAFASNRDTNWEIYISAVNKDDIQRVTFTPDAVELDPVWSPTDGRIVYESNRDGNWNLYMFDVSSGVEKQLTDAVGNEINASWSPDGKHVVYQSDGQGFWQIYELDMSTLASRVLSDGIGDDHGPQYSHDGQHIVFHSMREGDNSVIYIMNADGSDVTPISDPAGNALNHAWSPDDRFIAYQSNIDGDHDVYVYELVTKTTRKLTDNSINDYAPTWYCNAPVVAFTSDITGDSNVFSASVLPIKGDPIDVEKAANQLTTDTASDQYPVDSPAQESASRQESLPSPVKNK